MLRQGYLQRILVIGIPCSGYRYSTYVLFITATLIRCAFTATDVMVLMRQRGTSLDINTNEEYDCTVLFLWNKKLMTEKEDLESQDDT